MKKILTIMLMTTAIPAAAMAQTSTMTTSTSTNKPNTTIQGDANVGVDGAVKVDGVTAPAASATTSVEGATPSEVNAAEKMESDMKSGSEPVLNSSTTTTTTAPDMSATTNATIENKTNTELKATQPDGAMPSTTSVPAMSDTNSMAAPAATTTTTTDIATPAVEPVATTAKADVSTGVKTKANMSKSNVKELQNSLKSNGSYTGKVDGAWGPKTSAAISDYQSKNGLGVTGTLDTATVEKLGLKMNGATTASSSSSSTSGKHKKNHARKEDMNDPANRALESRVVPQGSTPAAAAASGASVNAPAPTAPMTSPSMAPATNAPMAAPDQQNASPDTMMAPSPPSSMDGQSSSMPAQDQSSDPAAAGGMMPPADSNGSTDSMAPAGNATENNTNSGYSKTY